MHRRTVGAVSLKVTLANAFPDRTRLPSGYLFCTRQAPPSTIIDLGGLPRALRFFGSSHPVTGGALPAWWLARRYFTLAATKSQGVWSTNFANAGNSCRAKSGTCSNGDAATLPTGSAQCGAFYPIAILRRTTPVSLHAAHITLHSLWSCAATWAVARRSGVLRDTIAL